MGRNSTGYLTERYTFLSLNYIWFSARPQRWRRKEKLEQFHNWCIPASTGADAHLFLNLNAGLKAGSSTVGVQQLWNRYSPRRAGVKLPSAEYSSLCLCWGETIHRKFALCIGEVILHSSVTLWCVPSL